MKKLIAVFLLVGSGFVMAGKKSIAIPDNSGTYTRTFDSRSKNPNRNTDFTVGLPNPRKNILS